MQKILLPLTSVFFLLSSLCAQNCVQGTPGANSKRATLAPILGVNFQDAPLLTPDAQEEIIRAATEKKFAGVWSREQLALLAKESAERALRIYQDEGYFKAVITGEAVRAVSGPPGRYSILLRVVDPGEQYRLGEIHIANTTVFSQQTLRDLFVLQRGDIFSREKVAKGMEEVLRLYDSQGYINYTGVPNFEFDEAGRTIDLELEVDEGKPYRLGSIGVVGIDPETIARIIDQLSMKPGNVYTAASWQRSTLKFHDAGFDQELTGINRELNNEEHLVNVVLDFRKTQPCPMALTMSSAVANR